MMFRVCHITEEDRFLELDELMLRQVCLAAGLDGVVPMLDDLVGGCITCNLGGLARETGTRRQGVRPDDIQAQGLIAECA